MELTFGASSVPSMQAISEAKDVQLPTKQSTQLPRSLELTALVARSILFNSTHSPIVVRFVVVPKPRTTCQDREERNIRDLLKRVKISKSEATQNQTKNQ